MYFFFLFIKNILLSCELDRYYIDNINTKKGFTELSIFNSNDLIIVNSKMQNSQDILIKLIIENAINMVICLNNNDKINYEHNFITNLSESLIDKDNLVTKRNIKFDIDKETIDFIQVKIDNFNLNNKNELVDVLMKTVAAKGIPNERILIYSE